VVTDHNGWRSFLLLPRLNSRRGPEYSCKNNALIDFPIAPLTEEQIMNTIPSPTAQEAVMDAFLSRVGEGVGLAAVMTSILLWATLGEAWLR
jgi:hypothetical protein